MSKVILDQASQAMDKSIQNLQRDLTKLRTGRANPALVDGVQVEYYGSMTPLNQVANVTTPDARTIQITPWEPSTIGAIEKAIIAANLGLTPQNDGKLVRLPVPALTEERRKDMVKMVKKMGEEAKVAIRNSRREANEGVKKLEKDKQVSEDESKKWIEQIQKKTDDKAAEVDKVVAAKEKEILTL